MFIYNFDEFLSIYLEFLSLQDDSTTCPASTSIILIQSQLGDLSRFISYSIIGMTDTMICSCNSPWNDTDLYQQF